MRSCPMQVHSSSVIPDTIDGKYITLAQIQNTQKTQSTKIPPIIQIFVYYVNYFKRKVLSIDF